MALESAQFRIERFQEKSLNKIIVNGIFKQRYR